MAQHASYMAGTQYNPADMMQRENDWISPGVLSISDLVVTPGSNLTVNVSGAAQGSTGGNAWLPGGYRFYNDAIQNIALATANTTNPRIDLIVAAIDTTQNPYVATIKAITGSPAASPSIPAIPGALIAIPLAKVAVAANATTISAGNITDVRTVAEIIPLSAHLADNEYQTPTIVGTQIRITRQSGTKRLSFYISADLSGGNITISLDAGATSLPLKDIDGVQLTQLSKGYVEVVDNTTFFTVAPSGGASETYKLFKGTNSPVNPKEYDMWLKSDNITVKKQIFDKDFSLAKTYDDGSLVFYITSNPTDQGYRILSELFNRNNKLSMKMPLYCCAFYSGGTWSYPIVYVYISGTWTYLSGALIDDNSRIMVYFGGISTKYLTVNSFKLDGTADIVDKIASTNVMDNYYVDFGSVVKPLDGTRYLWITTGNGSIENAIYVVDKSGNIVTVIPSVATASSTTSTHQLLLDDNYLYACEFYSNSLRICKIDTTTNMIVITTTLISVSTSYINAVNLFLTQDANYIYWGVYKISKATLTKITTGSNTTLLAGTKTDKNGRLIHVEFDTSTTMKVHIANKSDMSIIKAISINLPFSLSSQSGSQLRGFTLDKDDNIFVWLLEFSTSYSWVIKLVKDLTNDTWTIFTTYTSSFVMQTVNNRRIFFCDVFSNLYATLGDSNGYSFIKLNPNLQLVYTKAPKAGVNDRNLTLDVDPCNIDTDYTRQYFK